MRRRLEPVVALLVAAVMVGCSRTDALEQIPAGTEIQIETRSGSTLDGRLVETTADRVLLEEADGVKLAIRREDISAVRQAGDASPGRPAEKAAEAPAADPAVLYREITVPAGTVLPVSLETAVGSDTSAVEDAVRARVADAVTIGNVTAVPAGSELIGSVTAVERSGRVKGRAALAFRFSTLKLAEDEEDYAVRTATIARRAEPTTREDAAKIAIPAAGGAVIGAIAGGKKGAAIGSAVGGGAGTAVVLSTRGDEIRLTPGTRLRVQLDAPVTVRVRPRT